LRIELYGSAAPWRGHLSPPPTRTIPHGIRFSVPRSATSHEPRDLHFPEIFPKRATPKLAPRATDMGTLGRGAPWLAPRATEMGTLGRGAPWLAPRASAISKNRKNTRESQKHIVNWPLLPLPPSSVPLCLCASVVRPREPRRFMLAESPRGCRTPNEWLIITDIRKALPMDSR